MTAADKQATGDSPSRYVDFDEFIAYQVKKTRSGIHQTDLLAAGLVLALFTVTYLLTFVVLDQWVIPGGFGYRARVIMLTVVLASAVGWTLWRIVLPYFRRINALYAAREIEAAYPDLKSTLLTWVDLKTAGRPVPPSILQAIEKRAALEMAHKDIEHAIDRRFLMRCAYALLAVLAIFCLYTVFSPKQISASIWRALLPTSDVAVATTTSIVDVTPGDAEVLARSQVEVRAELAGVIPQEATLLYTTADRRFVDEPIAMHRVDESLPRFQATLTGENGRGLLQDVRYRIVAGDARSREFELRINQPPSATVTEVSYDYPTYMGLDDQTQPGGNIDAWEGTRVTVSAVTNMPVTSATILFSDTEDTSVRAEEIPMQVTDGVHLKATWTLAFRSDGTYPHFYRIQVRNQRDESDPQPTLKSVRIRPDLPPEIRLLHPTSDIEAPANGVVPVAYKALDPDFLLRRVVMKFEKQGEELPASPTLYEGPPFSAAVESTYRLELEQLNLKAGDKLSFYLRAEDNMQPFGDRLGNVRQTPKLNITIVDPLSPEQIQEQLKAQEKQIDELRQANQQQNAESPMPPQDQPRGEAEPAEEPNQENDAQEPAPGEARPEQGTGKSEPQPMNGESGEPSSENQTQPGQPQQDGASEGDSSEQQGAEQKTGGAGGEARPEQSGPRDPQNQPGGQKAPHSQSQRGAGEDPGTNARQEGDRQQPDAPPPGRPQDPAQTPSPEGAGQPGDRPRPDKAPEDEALRELLEWAERNQQENRPPERPENSSDSGQQAEKAHDSSQSKPGEQPRPTPSDAPPSQQADSTDAGKQPAEGTEGDKGESGKAGPGKSESDPEAKNSPPSPAPPKDRGQNPNGTGAPEPSSQEKDPSSSGQESGDSSPNTQGGQNPNGTGVPPQPPTAAPPSPENPASSPNAANRNESPMPGAAPESDPTAQPPANSTPKNNSGGASPGPQSADSSEKNATQPASSPAAGDQPKNGAAGEGSGNQSTPQPGKTGEKPGGTVPKPTGKTTENDGTVDKVPSPSGDPKQGASGGEKQPRPGDSATPPQDSQPGKPAGTEQQPGPPDQNGKPNGETGQGTNQNQPQPPPSKGTDSGGAGSTPPPVPNAEGQTPPTTTPKPGSPGSQADPNAPMPPGESGQGSEAMNRQRPEAGPSPSGTGTPGQNGKPAEGPSGQGTPSQPGTGAQKSGNSGQPGSEKGTGGSSSEGGQTPPMPSEGSGGQQTGGQNGQGGQGKDPSGQNGGKKDGSGAESGQGGQQKGGGGKSGEGKQGGGGAGQGAPEGGQAGQGAQGGQQSGNGSGQGQGAGGAPVGGGTGSPNAGGGSSGGSGGAGGEGGIGSPEAPNLANKKKAANLALQQLKDQLQRGETPEQLMDRLGYTQQDLEQFMRRLEQRLADPGIDDSPEAKAARRQFESLLRGVDYQSSGGVREGGDGPRRAASGFGAGNRPTPPEYRAAEQAYKKRLSESER